VKTPVRRIGGGYEIPAKRMEVGGKDVWRIEALAGQMAPVGLLEKMCTDLAFPEDRKVLAHSKTALEGVRSDVARNDPSLSRGQAIPGSGLL
jgi:hypothetical protein